MKKKKSKKIHKPISGPNYHCVTFLLTNNIKLIDVMSLNENYLICINTNKNDESQAKTIAIVTFWMGYEIYLASLKPIFMAARVVRGATEMPENIVLSNEHICLI